MKKIIITALALYNFAFVNAQENTSPPMITDRPDATESPTTVPLHTLQVETGGAYINSKENKLETEEFVYNTTLLRYGLFEDFELRLGWNLTEVKTKQVNTSINGLEPLLIGAKIGVVKENGLLPEIGFLGHIYHPFAASKPFKTETTGVDFRFSFAHTLNEKSSLSYNLGMEWGDDSPEAAYVYTLSYGLSLSDQIGFYAELYGDLPENNRANHYWDAGFTYLVKPRLQFDATVGTGINTNQKLLVSAGVSFRLPN